MRIDELSAAIYGILSTIIASQTVLASISVIRMYDNGPRPGAHYLAYAPNPIVREIGKAVHVPTTGTVAAQIIQTYSASVDVHEIGGDGEYLQLIQQMQYALPIVSYMTTAKMAIMSCGPILQAPRLLDNNIWEKEAVMEMNINFTHVTSDTTTYISTVEIINNIGE